MEELQKTGTIFSNGQSVAPHTYLSCVHDDTDPEKTADKLVLKRVNITLDVGDTMPCGDMYYYFNNLGGVVPLNFVTEFRNGAGRLFIKLYVNDSQIFYLRYTNRILGGDWTLQGRYTLADIGTSVNATHTIQVLDGILSQEEKNGIVDTQKKVNNLDIVIEHEHDESQLWLSLKGCGVGSEIPAATATTCGILRKEDFAKFNNGILSQEEKKKVASAAIAQELKTSGSMSASDTFYLISGSVKKPIQHIAYYEDRFSNRMALYVDGTYYVYNILPSMEESLNGYSFYKSYTEDNVPDIVRNAFDGMMSKKDKSFIDGLKGGQFDLNYFEDSVDIKYVDGNNATLLGQGEISPATEKSAGVMTAEDKRKLDAIHNSNALSARTIGCKVNFKFGVYESDEFVIRDNLWDKEALYIMASKSVFFDVFVNGVQISIKAGALSPILVYTNSGFKKNADIAICPNEECEFTAWIR